MQVRTRAGVRALLGTTEAVSGVELDDGSRIEAVDYKTYLKSHVRTSKTLTANSDAEEFDEYEERAVAQSDWAEDCQRYKLKRLKD